MDFSARLRCCIALHHPAAYSLDKIDEAVDAHAAASSAQRAARAARLVAQCQKSARIALCLQGRRQWQPLPSLRVFFPSRSGNCRCSAKIRSRLSQRAQRRLDNTHRWCGKHGRWALCLRDWECSVSWVVTGQPSATFCLQLPGYTKRIH